jgi:cytochrome c oxidase subunit II
MNHWLAQLSSADLVGSFWMPPQGSTFSRSVDAIFYFIFWVSVFFYVLIGALVVFFVIHYRRRQGAGPGSQISGNLALELTWTGIPVVLVLIMFIWGVKGMINLTTPPLRAYEIQVSAQRWQWSFTYPNGYVDKDLHVPVDVSVRLLMQSEDVIHAFYVPAFRIQQDIIPGQYVKTWFRATQPGIYQLFCGQYCGTEHSNMLADVVVHPTGEFEKWLENASNFVARLPPAVAGKRLYETRGCRQCHSIDGTAGIGPSFKGIFGHSVALRGMAPVQVDENYLRESIVDPMARIVAGFDPVMPTYKGRLRDNELTALIEYIKTLAEAKR